MPAALIHAVIQQESGYDAAAAPPAPWIDAVDAGHCSGISVSPIPRPGSEYQRRDSLLGATAGAIQRQYDLAWPPTTPGWALSIGTAGFRRFPKPRITCGRLLANYNRLSGGLPGDVAGTTLRHYRFGGGQYAVDLCGDIPVPIRTTAEDTAVNGVQTVMRNDVQTAHWDAYERMLEGMREVVT